MIETNITDRYTEIYVGGGNYLTESYPTNFHTFVARKILAPGEDISDYMEVTAKQRATLEASDAEWIEPPEHFVLECEAAGADYNRHTGYFVLNEINLTYKEMTGIYAFRSRCVCPPNLTGGIFENYPYRTTFKINSNRFGGSGLSASHIFYAAYSLEAVRFDPIRSTDYISWASAFVDCKVLRRITDISLSTYTMRPMTDAFRGCVKLETVLIANAWDDMSFKDSPLLSLESLEYIVEHSANCKNMSGKTREMTITLHPTTYAKLTDELIAKAADRMITFATST